MQCYLVLVETSGIQSFIFDTNKRRENVGASQLVANVGTWATEALQDLAAAGELPPGWTADTRIPDTRTDTPSAEIVTTAAGSAKVLVTDETVAKHLISRVTRTALVEAPGLDMCGAYVEFDWHADGAATTANRDVHRLVPVVRARRPGSEARFPRLPIVDQCASSGLPASHLRAESPEVTEPEVTREPPLVPCSRPSTYKIDAANRGYDRLAAITIDDRPDGLVADVDRRRKAARDGIEAVADYLERRADWVAVAHADGDDLGAIVASLHERLPDARNRAYVNALRDFSDALDRAARQAYQKALAALEEDQLVPQVKRSPTERAFPPVLPLVLGGDDLTVVCDGRAALGFIVAYLRAFEERTAAELAELAKRAKLKVTGDWRLGASAGVAIVKAHYPFSSAYHLAEDLTDEAKQVKRRVPGPASALSFHVLHDSAATSLDDLRARQTLDEGATRVVAQPYVVAGADSGWTAHRGWDDLCRRVAALRATGPSDGTYGRTRRNGRSGDGVPPDSSGVRDGGGARLLPRSQTHVLRDALYDGYQAADARLALLLPRYGRRGLADLTVGDSLFWEDPDGRRLTGLLDAMDAEPFLGSLPESSLPGPGDRPAGSDNTSAREVA